MNSIPEIHELRMNRRVTIIIYNFTRKSKFKKKTLLNFWSGFSLQKCYGINCASGNFSKKLAILKKDS